MRRLTLSQRLFLVTAFALLPALAILLSNIVTLQKTRTREVHIEALRTAELASLEMERILSGTENVLRVVIAAPVVQQGDTSACSAFLDRAVASLPYLASLTVINADGNVRCMPDLPVQGLYLGDRQYFTESLQTSERVTGQFTIGRVTERKVLPIALRFGDTVDETGVAVAYVDLNWLQSTLKERTLPPGNSLTIADRDGRILAREPNPEEFVGTVIPEAFQRLVHASGPGTEELVSQDGTRRMIGYIPVSGAPRGIYVSAGVSTKAAFQTVFDVTVLGIAISLLGTVAAFLLARHTSRTFIITPFNRLIDTVEAWRYGQTDVRTNMVAAEGELGRAGSALDGFMDELIATRAARQQAEEQRRLLTDELNHRVKNMLQMVQAVARQTFSGAGVNDAVATFSGRLRAMSGANALLLQDQWKTASVQDVVESSVAPFIDPKKNQIILDGPTISLPSRAVLALGMALHELCTNAAKYGALSVDPGRVSITWGVAGKDGEDQFFLRWKESGGPEVKVPAREGFGTTIIEQVLASQISGHVALKYEVDGVSCVVSAPLRLLQENEERSGSLDAQQ